MMRGLFILGMIVLVSGGFAEANLLWEKDVQGYGCGKYQAKADLDRLTAQHSKKCANDGGVFEATINSQPFCSEPEPQNLSCQKGECWWPGTLTCRSI